MKVKSFVLMLALAASVPVFANEASLSTEHPGAAPGCMSSYTPLKLTLAGPVGLPWGDWDVYGLEVGIWNDTTVMKSLQIGVVNVISGKDCSFFWTDEQEIRKDQKRRVFGM